MGLFHELLDRVLGITHKEPVPKPTTNVLPIDEKVSEEFQDFAVRCNMAINMGKKPETYVLKKLLFKDYYARDDHKLLQITSQATQPIGLAYANIALHLKFNDEDLGTVAAENAVYCLGRGIIEKNNTYCAPSLFTILLLRRDLLKHKLIATHRAILKMRGELGVLDSFALDREDEELQLRQEYKSFMGSDPTYERWMSISSGGPAPLSNFKSEATNERVIAILSYLLTLFYDQKSSTYKVPTDLYLNVPSKSDIDFLWEWRRQFRIEWNLIEEGKNYFYELFSQCQKSLSKKL